MFKILSCLFILALSSYQTATAEITAPNAIKVPEGNKPLLTVKANGDQIYLCSLDSGAYSWKWQSPDAKLYATDNKTLVGSHGEGPSWAYKDGSSVKAKLMQKADVPNKANIPWLLLAATENKGVGLLTQTSYIQRINTLGGLSPNSGCDANHLGTEKRVPYRADYIFYAK
jgi:Protein of unknown function (DUF3455)